MVTGFLIVNEVRQMDIVQYLEQIGYQPQKIRNNDYWYLSLLRAEKEASFKFNRKLNLWYDHGLGKGGSIIDFGILNYKCSILEFTQILFDSFFFTVKTQRFNSLGKKHKARQRHLNLK